ncbi:MAG: response regulator [Gammaproteobacteria bacterium]|nr:response regulator [Gammaproteobacteria bacterium]
MPTPIMIVDDSSFARKQMARALPDGWDVEVTFACDGSEGLAALKCGHPEYVFLDLNMPVMDGYQMLEAMNSEGLSSKVIVVSGDIQPEAHQRVLDLGAVEFIKKPVRKDQVASILTKHGVRENSYSPLSETISIKTDVRDGCREIANVAMGRAADLLARLLDVFVVMPIPNVNMIETSELHMALNHVAEGETISAVCQGFIGSGIAGEALLIFNESSFTDIADMMKHTGNIDETVELELLMDISNILIGACLKGIADQMDIDFSQGHPVVLGRHVKIGDIIKRNASRWNKTLAIEMGYRFENKNINCDLLLLFTEDSLETINDIVSCLVVE